MDGDARGGAALSIYGVTKEPIKYIGVGEKLDALEEFHPDRMAGRILQQGDILSLVEKAQGAFDEKEAERLAKKVTSKKGIDLEDFLGAMKQMQKMGPLKSVLGMLPGVNPTMLQAAKIDDKKLKHVEAIVLSMTPKERTNPDVHQRPAPAPDRQGLRAARSGSEHAARRSSADAEDHEDRGEDRRRRSEAALRTWRFPRLTRSTQEHTWQLAFASAASAARSSPCTASWSPTRSRRATGGSSRSSAPTTPRATTAADKVQVDADKARHGSPRAPRRPSRRSLPSSFAVAESWPACTRVPLHRWCTGSV